MALFLPQRWRQQPQYTVDVDWSTPLAASLAFDFSPFDYIDVVTQSQGVNTGVTRSALATGVAAKFTRASSQSINFGDRPEWDTGSNNFSFEFMFRMAAAATDTVRYQLLSKDAVSGRQVWTEINTTNTGSGTENSLSLVWLNGTLMQTRTPANSLVVGKTHHCVIQRSGASEVTAWIDGAPQTITYINTSSAAIAATSTAVELGSRVFTTNRDFFDGDIQIARFRNRALTHSEVRALYENPWQIYRPQTARIYSFPSGAGDITLTGSLEILSLTEYAGQTGVSIDVVGALETLALVENQGVTGVSIDLTGALETLSLVEYTGTLDVGADINLTGTLETLSLTEYAGTTGVEMALTGALEVLALTEYAGTVSVGQDISLTGNLETLALTEYAGVTGVTIDLAGTLEVLSLVEYTGTFDVGFDISLTGTLEVLSLVEPQGLTGVSIDLQGSLETLALTEYTGTVSITNDIVLTGTLEVLSLVETAGVTSVSIDLTGTTEVLSIVEPQGLPGVSMDLTGVLETLALTEYTGTLTYSEGIQLVGQVRTLALTEFAGTITLDVSLTGSLETLLLTEYTGTLLLYDPLARVWRQFTFVNDERRLETTVSQAVENSFISSDEADTFVTGT